MKSNKKHAANLKAATLIFTGVAMAAFALPAHAGDFECPAPHGKTTQSSIKETPTLIQEYSGMLAGGTQDNAIDEIIFKLRIDFPKASDAEIANFLTTAYCPILKGDDYPDELARQHLARFQKSIDARLFNGKG